VIGYKGTLKFIGGDFFPREEKNLLCREPDIGKKHFRCTKGRGRSSSHRKEKEKDRKRMHPISARKEKRRPPFLIVKNEKKRGRAPESRNKRQIPH